MRDINDYEKKYVDDYDFEKYMVKYRRNNILEVMSKYHHKRILEIGCGMEPLFINMQHDFEKFVVVEPSDLFYENACKLAGINEQKGGGEIVVYHNFFENLTAKIISENFDYVIISGLLHEIETPQSFISSVLKICNENTVVYVNVPNANSIHRLLAKESGLISEVHNMSERNKIMQQHTVFDIDSLVQLIVSTDPNIEILEKGSYFVKPFTHKQMSECMSNGIIDEKIINGFNDLIKYMPDYGAEIYTTFKIK